MNKNKILALAITTPILLSSLVNTDIDRINTINKDLLYSNNEIVYRAYTVVKYILMN